MALSWWRHGCSSTCHHSQLTYSFIPKRFAKMNKIQTKMLLVWAFHKSDQFCFIVVLFAAEPGMQDSQKQGLQLLALAQAKSLTTSRKVETSYKLHLHLLKVNSQLHVLLLREPVEMQYNILSILMLSVICTLQIMLSVLSFFLSLVVVILHWDMKLCCSGHMWNSVLWQQMQRFWLQSFQSMMKETAKYSTQPPWKQAMI